MVLADEVDLHAPALGAEVEADDDGLFRLALDVAGVDEEAIVSLFFSAIDPEDGGLSVAERGVVLADFNEAL